MRYKNRIKELRMAAGITQAELAYKIGQPQPYIARIESGRRPVQGVTGRLLYLMMKALDCSFETLIEEHEIDE